MRVCSQNKCSEISKKNNKKKLGKKRSSESLTFFTKLQAKVSLLNYQNFYFHQNLWEYRPAVLAILRNDEVLSSVYPVNIQLSKINKETQEKGAKLVQS